MKANLVKRVMVLFLALVFVLSIAACGTAKEANPESTPAPTESATPEPSAPPADPMAKYEPAITLTTVRSVDASFKFKEGDSIDNNVFYRAYRDELGIDLKNTWVVEGSQFEQKMSVSIASNDLPDIFNASSAVLQRLIEADMVADLTPYLASASEYARNCIESQPVSKAAATFGGKFYGIPPQQADSINGDFLYVRADWLQKLGLQGPATMEDVLKIADAFTNQDPDGNNKKDTYGLTISKDLLTMAGYGGVMGFFNGYHAYPKIWVKDASGQLTYGSTLPEVKTALVKLQEMFKAGQLDKEFGIKDGGKASELQVAGKVGMYYGTMWTPMWPDQDGVNKDLKAEWTCYPIVSADDKPAKTQVNNSFDNFYVVNKQCKNPEAIFKLYHFNMANIYGKNAKPEIYHTDKSDPNNPIETHHYAVVKGGRDPETMDVSKNTQALMAAIKAKDPSALTPEFKGYYESCMKYLGGDRTQWSVWKVFGENGTWDVADREYYAKGNYLFNEFTGAATPTMTEKGSTLDKLEAEAFTAIIMGKDASEFDKFVENWKKLGGDAITKEVNDWYAKKQ